MKIHYSTPEREQDSNLIKKQSCIHL